MTPSPLQDASPCPPFYNHESLPSAETHIRLLCLQRHPREGENEGSLTFSTVAVPCTPERPPTQPYDAISWMWDPPSQRDTCSLTINGTNLAISTNMYNILNQLVPSESGTQRLVWIDSICINQRDQREKGKQISLMTTIYKSARRVVAFPGSAATSPAFSLRDLVANTDAYLRAQELGSALGSNRVNNHSDVPSDPEERQAFVGLVSSRFWTRAWIIQEIVVARSVALRCGGCDIDFDLLGRVAMAFKTIHPQTLSPLLAFSTWVGADEAPAFRAGIDLITRLHDFRGRYATGNMYSVPDCLLECVQSQATENQDKVWALAGIGGHLSLSDWDPSLSTEDRLLFAAVARHALQHTTGGSRYALLGMAGRENVRHRSERDNRWPSWVPDLVAAPKVYPMGNAKCPYTIGRKFTAEVDSAISHPGFLRVKGILLDKLALVNMNNPWVVRGDGRAGAELEAVLWRAVSGTAADTECQTLFQQQMEWLRTMRQDSLAHYNLVGQDTERYVLSYNESLMEAILRTVIGNHDVEFPASNQTISIVSSTFRILYLAMRAMCLERETEEDRKFEHDLWMVDFAARLRISGPYESAGRSRAEAEQRALERGAEIRTQMEDEPESLSDRQLSLMAETAANILVRRSSGRQFAISTLGFMLLVPSDAEPGDLIAIFGEAKMAYLLRPCEDYSGAYTLVGEAYVHGTGIMEGENMGGLASGAGQSDAYHWFSIR